MTREVPLSPHSSHCVRVVSRKLVCINCGVTGRDTTFTASCPNSPTQAEMERELRYATARRKGAR